MALHPGATSNIRLIIASRSQCIKFTSKEGCPCSWHLHDFFVVAAFEPSEKGSLPRVLNQGTPKTENHWVMTAAAHFSFSYDALPQGFSDTTLLASGAGLCFVTASCPVNCRMLSSFPGRYPLDPVTTPATQLWQLNLSQHCQLFPLEGRIASCWEPLFWPEMGQHGPLPHQDCPLSQNLYISKRPPVLSHAPHLLGAQPTVANKYHVLSPYPPLTLREPASQIPPVHCLHSSTPVHLSIRELKSLKSSGCHLGHSLLTHSHFSCPLIP